MLLAIKDFRWNTLVLEDTARVCQWYAQNMDSALILEKDSIVWRTLAFLKQVCGFFYLEGLVTDDIVITKRNIYVQVMELVVKIIVRLFTLVYRTFTFHPPCTF